MVEPERPPVRAVPERLGPPDRDEPELAHRDAEDEIDRRAVA